MNRKFNFHHITRIVDAEAIGRRGAVAALAPLEAAVGEFQALPRVANPLKEQPITGVNAMGAIIFHRAN
jgi:hypothetical protein